MKQLDSEQQRVMREAFNKEMRTDDPLGVYRSALYAAGAALREMEARRAVVDRHNYVECGDGLCGCGHGIEHPCHSKRPAPAEGAKAERFPIDRTDAYEERIDAERQAPRAESQDTVEEIVREMLYVLQRGPGMQAGMTAALAVARRGYVKLEAADALNGEVENWMNRCEELQDQLADARRGYHSTEDVESAINLEGECKVWQGFARAVLNRLTTQGKETKG